MVSPDEEGDCSGDEGSLLSFRADLKCCTYLPELPNFSVGAILSEQGAGVASIRRRIANRESVTPLAIGQSPARSEASTKSAGFGRDPALLCAHYAEGGCSIWAHRDAVCATFFCKLERGEVGARFWASLHVALSAIERAVARACMLKIGVPAGAIAELARQTRLAPQRTVFPSAAMDAQTYRRVWATWEGREEEFFIACGRAADALSWEDVRREGGAELELVAQAARHEYERLMTRQLPNAPVTRALQIRPAGSEWTHVVAYSAADPLVLPPSVVSALGHFDGRPLAEALAAARARERVAISEELVQTLADFGAIGDLD